LLFMCPLLPRLRSASLSFPTRRSSDLVLVTAGIIHLAGTRPYQGRVLAQRLEGAIRPESQGFDELSGLLVVEQLVAAEASCSTTDRKSTRLNSSHQIISYAVFCLKKTT